jgi:N-acetylmuramoyl-L-alanine amidase
MSRFSSLLPRFIIAAVLLVGLAFLLFRKSPPVSQTPVLPEPLPSLALSDLAAPPDWSTLEAYQGTMTRAEFEQLMTGVFTTGNGWRSVISVDDAEARIQTGPALDMTIFHLRFAQPGQETKAPRTWRTAAELPPAPLEKPLAGLRIAIDPGHIGGVWAKMEERWLALGTDSPICEGDMTLQVAQLLKPQLEALGATVSLVRENSQPVTSARPDTLLAAAEESPPTPGEALKQRAERLFYRTAEIHARAQRVNEVLRPDLVLCLHFNAEAWGDPTLPTLTDRHHLHLLLNGAYSDAEVLLADQRHALLSKLLQHRAIRFQKT